MIFNSASLVKAFERDEFVPYFQPLLELRTGKLAGFEVLARWNHGEFGTILPDDFIPILERNGLIDMLTHAILSKAFATRAILGSPLTLAINISPTQLLDCSLPERIAKLASSSGFELNRLTVEITESALLEDPGTAKAAALELKALDCCLALDDFGTGYSSLKHLLALPFDEIKVDPGFVNSMAVNRDSRKVVASVVGLGQSLGMTTVAEGVETREQADMLLRLGCDLAQGWLYGKAVSGGDLEATIAALSAQASPLSPVAYGDSLVSQDALPIQRLAQLQAIYDGTPVGLCFLDKNLRYLSLNRCLAEYNGIPAAAHLGRTPADILPHFFPKIEPFIRRALGGEPILNLEIQKPPRIPGGHGQTLLISYQPVRDEAEEVLGVSVAIVDITETKRVQRALRDSEDHLRHMIELSPHIPWVLNAKGEVIEASPRWEIITGQSRDDALGDGWLQMLHPDDLGHTILAVHSAVANGRPIDIVYRVYNPRGEYVEMRSRGNPRFGPSGEVVCIYGLVEEVSDPHDFE